MNRKLFKIAIRQGGWAKFFVTLIYSFGKGYFQPMLADDGTLIITPIRKDLIPDATKEDWMKANVGLQAFLEEARTAAFQEIASEAKDDRSSNDDKLKSMIGKKPEVIFIKKVWLPCILLYREMPLMLLRRAREGDMDALELRGQVSD